MEEDPEALFAPLRESAKRSGIFLDFDGTLSPIVAHHDKARPVKGAIEIINQLSVRFGVVAVISGRPLEFLRKHLPVNPTVRLCGLYGLQRLRNGKVVESSGAAKARDIVAEGATTAESQLPKEITIERKGLSFGLHYRNAPQFANVVEEWAAMFAASSGLDAKRGRQNIEIGPFHGIDKGLTATELAGGLRYVCAMGDDVGDLAMFRALDKMSKESSIVQCIKVAVKSTEAPTALLKEANYTVDSPESAVQLLKSFAS